MMLHRDYFAPMLVETGDADAMISGLTRNYFDTFTPVSDIIGKKEGASLISSMYIVNAKEQTYFLADCTVNKNPTKEQLVEITLQTVFAVQQFNLKPRVAFVS